MPMNKDRVITYREAVREALRQAMYEDEKVFLLGEDIGVYGGAFGVTEGLIEEFGAERVRDTPISELGITGVAVGAAITGMRPVVDIQFSDFLTLALDQIVNQAAKLRYMYGGEVHVPLVIRTPSGAGTGASSQHSQSLEAWLAHIPGLKVVQPSLPYCAKGLLLEAIRDPNPVIVYEHKLLYDSKSPVPEEAYSLPLGQARVVQTGQDLTLVATGIMVERACEVAKIYQLQGIEIEIIDPRSLLPFDEQTILDSVKKTGRLLIVHEAVKFGGFGGEIASIIAEKAFPYLKAPIKRLGGAFVPIPYSKPLETLAVPQAEDILQAVEELLTYSL